MVAPEDEDESSKTEEPSERKISKAKEEGDVAISQDAKSFIMLLGTLFVIWLFVPIMCRWLGQMGASFIERSGNTHIDKGNFIIVFEQGVFGFFKIMAIPFLIFMVLGIFASLSQTGFIYAPKSLNQTGISLIFLQLCPNLSTSKKSLKA